MHRKIMMAVLVVVTVVVLVCLWHEPMKVRAQGGKVGELGVVVGAPSTAGATNPSCTSNPVLAVGGTGGAYSDYPLFACVADLDGNGEKETIVGVPTNVGGVGAPGSYKVTIINSNGTVRAAVSVP
jgi:hypothetical protein